MKFRKLIIVVLVPLLLGGCGGKESIIDLPAPIDNTGGDNNNGNTDEKDDGKDKPWDANRGKVVTPEGMTNWTTTVIDEGVKYYSFSGVDAITGVKQEVFAVDVDLSNKNYQTKLVYTNPRKITSDAFKLEAGTICAMNANYEPGSIFTRVAGNNIYLLQNVEISDTGVPNWKSEAAFSSDRQQGVKIFYYGSQKKGEKTVPQQREYYRSLSVTEYPDLISSAPMLINDFNPIGENFCDYTLSETQANKLNSEHPDRHQRVRHPRSAVALTENNHLILLVVDGRTTFSNGMSARELTDFFVKYFNPQYALNMDGGGSSSIVVKGQGDPKTHVVNYPCDDQKNHYHDHYGERSRDIHFVVVKK